MKKKLTSIVLAVTMIFSLCGCGSNTEKESVEVKDVETEEVTEETAVER